MGARLAGGGITQIVMPYITVGIAQHQPETLAWRYAFLVPACCHVVIAVLILTLAQACLPHVEPRMLAVALKGCRADSLVD